MKDYVFIGWSRNHDLAVKIKSILDEKGFVCVVGGVYEGNPESVRIRRGTINETINFQLNHCDQSIMLFQKTDEKGGISSNLIYELGYVTAQYNFAETATKLHIFKLDMQSDDSNIFPTDLHGIWGTPVSSAGRSVDDVAKEVADVFLNNQSQIKRDDKFAMLNNHYIIEYEMNKHFDNPAMSDYDLAAFILIYCQAAFCYQLQTDIRAKLQHFKNKLIERKVKCKQLSWAVDYALQTLELFCMTIPDRDEKEHASMNGLTFRRLLARYAELGEEVGEEFPQVFDNPKLSDMRITREFYDMNDTESWIIAQMQEHVTYLILVYLTNKELSETEIKQAALLGVKYALVCIDNLQELAKNEWDNLYASMLLCYAYKNLSTFYSLCGNENECAVYRRKSFKARKELNKYVSGVEAFNPSLKDYIALEYLMQALEQVKITDDCYEREDYIAEISEYIDKRKILERNRHYMFLSLIDSFTPLLNESTQE